MAKWRGATGRHVPTQGVMSTCNPMFESVSNGFLPKEASFIFLPLRSQNWPDLGSRISKFRDIHFIDTGTYINRWKCRGDRSFGIAMTNIQTFSEVNLLDVTWWPDLEWPGSFSHVQKRCMNRHTKKRRRGPAPFFRCSRKTWGGGRKNAPPSTAQSIVRWQRYYKMSYKDVEKRTNQRRA